MDAANPQPGDPIAADPRPGDPVAADPQPGDPVAVNPDSSDRVLVYGAYGHTGRFVLADLLRRGLRPVLSGRDPEKLAVLSRALPGVEVRVAAVDDPASLRRAMSDVTAVINCAGPFLDTALPVAEAAIHAGVHYLDIAAEQAAVRSVRREHGADASMAGVAVVPAMGFYGGLADLLATAALEGGTTADTITVAVGLDRWWPTDGTRRTGRRNTVPRVVVRDGRVVPLSESPAARTWAFPEPIGRQSVVEVPFSEIITMASHLRVRRIRSYLNVAPLEDLRDVRTPPPEAVDEQGRSAQRFVVEVVLEGVPGAGDDGAATPRRIRAAGRDIYAVTASIVVEAAARLLAAGRPPVSVLAPAAAFDATDVLRALPSEVLRVTRF